MGVGRTQVRCRHSNNRCRTKAVRLARILANFIRTGALAAELGVPIWPSALSEFTIEFADRMLANH
jgi:hypothetical protein